MRLDKVQGRIGTGTGSCQGNVLMAKQHHWLWHVCMYVLVLIHAEHPRLCSVSARVSGDALERCPTMGMLMAQCSRPWLGFPMAFADRGTCIPMAASACTQQLRLCRGLFPLLEVIRKPVTGGNQTLCTLHVWECCWLGLPGRSVPSGTPLCWDVVMLTPAASRGGFGS